MHRSTWILGGAFALSLLVNMALWARRDPGDGGRVPPRDPPRPTVFREPAVAPPPREDGLEILRELRALRAELLGRESPPTAASGPCGPEWPEWAVADPALTAALEDHDRLRRYRRRIEVLTGPGGTAQPGRHRDLVLLALAELLGMDGAAASALRREAERAIGETAAAARERLDARRLLPASAVESIGGADPEGWSPADRRIQERFEERCRAARAAFDAALSRGPQFERYRDLAGQVVEDLLTEASEETFGADGR